MIRHNTCLKTEPVFKFGASCSVNGIAAILDVQVGTIGVSNWKWSSNSSQVACHMEFWSYLLSFTMDPAQLAYQQTLRCHQAHLHMACLFSLFIKVIILNVAAIICAQYLKQPWHTSILTGQMWVLELLGGHPECTYSHRAWSPYSCLLCSHWWASFFGLWWFKVCHSWGATGHLPLLLCHWLNS